MNLIELYNSGSKDIVLFNLLFIFYGIASFGLLFGLLKVFKQNVAFIRFLIGSLVFFVGSLVIFDVWFGMVKHYGQQIPGPAAGILLIIMGLSLGNTVMYVITHRIIFRLKEITKSTIGFVAAQPLLAIIFFGFLIVSGI